jgi:hypothetical protein
MPMADRGGPVRGVVRRVLGSHDINIEHYISGRTFHELTAGDRRAALSGGTADAELLTAAAYWRW